MVSRGHLLYFILLPVLARVAADDADEQIISDVVMAREHEAADTSANTIRSPPRNNLLADSPLPPALLLQLLQSNSPREDAPFSPPQTQSAHPVGEYVEGEVNKRVFCNGFTGCGGRHRDRSRRQERYGKRLIPLLVKRPFCNSFGCYNGKRSLDAFSLVEPVQNYRARVLARMLAAASAERRQEEGNERGQVVNGALGKRLFCNGYGGCRGGKRSLFSPWLTKMNAVADGRR